MANVKDIKRRIKTVRNIQQITRAMKMVAAAKLRKAQTVLENARPYSDKIVEVLERIGEVTDLTEHPLLQVRDVKHTGLIVITADKGLCGSYNANVVRETEAAIDRLKEQASIIAVGRKGRDVLRKRGHNIIGEYIDLDDYPDFTTALEIGDAVIEYYLTGLVDSVQIVYTRFINTIRRQVQVEQLLPVVPAERRAGVKVEYIFDPSPNDVLDKLLPRYIATTIHRALLEAKASEQSARMTAMDAATENAEEMIKKLTLMFNRARQAAITTELMEIVGGAEALK